MAVFRCVSCQHEELVLPAPWVPPSQCRKCGGGVTFVGDASADDAAPNSAPLAQRGLHRTATSGTKQRVFMSTMLYGLSRELGPADAVAELHRQVDELSSAVITREDYLPVASLLDRAAKLFEVQLLVDAGASNIAKARSRHAHEFLKSGCDVWITVDDDVDASSETLQALYDAVAGGAPSVCAAPCLLRDQGMANVAFEEVVVDRKLDSGAHLRSMLFAGLGLCAISREALLRHAVQTRFVDDDGEAKIGFFDSVWVPRRVGDAPSEMLYDWYGEDLSFFLGLERSVRVEALLTGMTKHAGELLDLGKPFRPMPMPSTWFRKRSTATEHKAAPKVEGEAPPTALPAPGVVQLGEERQSLSLEQQALWAAEQAASAAPAPAATGGDEGQSQEQQEAEPAAGL